MQASHVDCGINETDPEVQDLVYASITGNLGLVRVGFTRMHTKQANVFSFIGNFLTGH